MPKVHSKGLNYTGHDSSALVSPWSAQTKFGTINLLGGLTATGPNLTTNFAYDTSGSPYFEHAFGGHWFVQLLQAPKSFYTRVGADCARNGWLNPEAVQ
jgi:hypothetical protein